MSRVAKLQHRFVDRIPEQLDEGTLYISVELGTVVHKCCCGCGNEVVTPLAPTDWKLTFDGDAVSLYPSIGNWSFTCRSHYWINDSRVSWAGRWSQDEIDAGRRRDRSNKEHHFAGAAGGGDREVDREDVARQQPDRVAPPARSWFSKLWDRLFG